MHFEDVTESEMYASSEGSRKRKVDDVQMVISSQGEETDVTKMENKASSFSTFSNIYLSVLSKIPLPRRYSAPINDRRQPEQRDQSEDNNMAAEIDEVTDMGMDEVVTRGGKKKNKVGSFSALKHLA